jgi:hypothetical protein
MMTTRPLLEHKLQAMATHSETLMNKSKQCNNKSGVTGADWFNGNKWRTSIQIDVIRKHLGCFVLVLNL